LAGRLGGLWAIGAQVYLLGIRLRNLTKESKPLIHFNGITANRQVDLQLVCSISIQCLFPSLIVWEILDEDWSFLKPFNDYINIILILINRETPRAALWG
jgi:hypothetical protein